MWLGGSPCVGITDSSMESLRRYDENYFRFYPYLESFIDWNAMRGKRVLEIGLGYGSVSQKIAESGADFTGLDIAANPVKMVNHRLAQSGLPGEAVQGSIFANSLSDNSFDAIVAIGCLHHTGNLAAAIAACRRLLVPGDASSVWSITPILTGSSCSNRDVHFAIGCVN